MRIGELAQAADTTTKTLRFYEDQGLLPPAERTPAGYRDYTGDILAQERFPLAAVESHETLLAKCQMAARRIAAGPIARDLPALWRTPAPQGTGSYWPRVNDTDRTLDFRKDVAEVLRRVRAFGAIETIARQLDLIE